MLRQPFLVVTRYKNFVQYLQDRGIIGEDNYVCAEHVSIEQVYDRHVIGRIPFTMASAARSVTVFRFRTPRDLMGKDLTLEELKKYETTPITFFIDSYENYDFSDLQDDEKFHESET